MEFSIHQLRGFVTVAEEQHVGRAAARLNLTQPALTRQIQGLERELGVSLFDRISKGVRRTAAGEVFLAHALRVLALADAAPEATRRAASGETGALRLGFTAIGAYAVLADFLALIGERVPAVAVALSEMVSPDQFAALADLTIDVGLVRPPIPEQFESVLVHSEDLMVAVPAGHTLAPRTEPVSLAEVTDQYIGYTPEGSRYLHDICAAMIGMNRYAVSHLASQVPTMLALVRAGLGCALVPRSITAMGVEGVRFLELVPDDGHSVTLHACWNPDNQNPALHRLAGSLTLAHSGVP